MLGLMMGFYVAGDVPLSVMFKACLGMAIALSISGLSSAYISEAAEKKKELHELEQAMISDLGGSDYGVASRLLPLLIALINGLAPLLLSLFIILPLWLAQYALWQPLEPLHTSIMMAFIALFFLGIFLSRISETFWLWSALKTTVIGLFTVIIIFFFEL